MSENNLENKTSDSKDLIYKIFDQELKNKSSVTWSHTFNMASQGLSGKESSLPMQEMQKTWLPSLGWEDTWEEKMATLSSIPAQKSRGQGSLVGYNLQGHKEVDTTERLSHI